MSADKPFTKENLDIFYINKSIKYGIKHLCA